MSSRHVLHLIPGLELGGSETLLFQLLKCAEKSNFKYSVLCLGSKGFYSEKISALGINVIHLNVKREDEYSSICKIIKAILKESPSILHSHCTYSHYWIFPFLFIIRLIFVKKIFLCHTIHSTFDYNGVRFILFEKILNIIGCRQIAVGKLIRDYHCMKYHVVTKRIKVIYNGILPFQVTNKRKFSCRIVTIGNLIQNVKGYETAIPVILSLSKRYPSLTYHIIGEGSYRKNIEDMLPNRFSPIILHGRLSNIYPVLSQSDIYLLPSVREGLPLSLLEAMSCGLPIVATKVGEIPNILSNEDAELIPSANPEAMKLALEGLIRSQQKRKKYSKKSLKRIRVFHIAKTLKNYEELYMRMTK